MMKRSHSIKLVLIGSTLVFLSACDEKPESSKANKTAATAFDAPQTETYMSKEECEKIHGEGKCGAQPHASGSGSVFMPMMAGYMLGSMFNQPKSAPAATINSEQDNTRRGGFGGQAKRYSSAGG
ncbi:DUF1190 domain-containing protein [Candidatus Paracaedibacter symbiosus]|uniref:DUF1190 domain-containing protein n=1 Tax=Candidatus Paracaedibacter symbiosus TaxID=244582 RepID=UPI00068A9D82|nr:DUF1190 domain-containing protein [Candidatus Paracaedibacter symbiosus]